MVTIIGNGIIDPSSNPGQKAKIQQFSPWINNWANWTFLEKENSEFKPVKNWPFASPACRGGVG